ncbi:group 1 truncated hemoglobin [Sphingomonas sp. JC676]|uniref:group I truncated hemoglobin n=1 Tax=Sphingomonas sp. JC676 TaxID=2768065 RepID=UPI00292A5BFE|nr:group 1 truncated hemoglobin [Sphingomonas sp. JC676]
MKSLLLAAALLVPGTALAQSQPYAMPGEDKVDPYTPSNHNAGAKPFAGDGMAKAFHGQDGIRRIVETFVESNYADPVIGEIFMGHDKVRLKRTLFEQFCYILNAGCNYTGRDLPSSHKNLGTQQADMNKLVENLQAAMRKERVGFHAQNRFLAKLAPMHKDVVDR